MRQFRDIDPITGGIIIFPLREPQEAPETNPETTALEAAIQEAEAREGAQGRAAREAAQEAYVQEWRRSRNLIPTSETQFDGAQSSSSESLHPTAAHTAGVPAPEQQAKDTLPSISEGYEGSEGTATVSKEPVDERLNLLYKECPVLFQPRVYEESEEQPKTPSFGSFKLYPTAFKRDVVAFLQPPVKKGSEEKAKIPTPVEDGRVAVLHVGDPFESADDPFYTNNFAAYHREAVLDLELSHAKPACSKVDRVFHCVEDGFIGATAYELVKKDSTPFVYVHLVLSIFIAIARFSRIY